MEVDATVGLTIYSMAGICGWLFSFSFPVLFLWAGMLGLGMGMFIPTLATVVNNCFQGDEGSADMVAIARALLANPDMLNKSYAGHPEKATPCLRCWNCISGGGLSGMESALALAMDGCEVTVVDMKPEKEFAEDASPCLRGMLLKLLDDYKVRLLGGHIVREVNDEGVLVEGRDWRYQLLEADHVVNALGMKLNPLAEAFRELTPHVYFVGDCSKVGNVLNANLTAYDRSCNI